MGAASINETITYSAFQGHHLVAQGQLVAVLIKVKERLGRAENSDVLIFSDETGKQMDFNFQGTKEDVLKRIDVFVKATEFAELPGPGRPKLGVVSREVSLLPRHWEWLATQTGGASATLRKLIEDARRTSSVSTGYKQAQERTYKFMLVMAGDLNDFEEALRALYQRDQKKFYLHIKSWPSDVRKHTVRLAESVF